MKNTTEKKYEIITLESKINVVIPENVYNQVVYLTKLIDKVEWSGIMFYDTEGDITNIETFKIILKEIFLMDKGSSATTEFDLDSDVVEFWSAQPERSKWKMGLIHSHNNMGVFFSGTDTEELTDNAPNHNYYFSIITNNKLDFEAKVAFLGKSESQNIIEEYKCKKSDGSDYIMRVKVKDISDSVFVHNCKIELDVPKISVSEEFENRVKKINEEEKKYVTSSLYKSYDSYDDDKDIDDWYGRQYGGFFNKSKKDKKKENKILFSDKSDIKYADYDFLRHILRCALSPKFTKDDHRTDFIANVFSDLSKEAPFWRNQAFESSLKNITEYLKSWTTIPMAPYEIKGKLAKAILILKEKESQFPYGKDYIPMIEKYLKK